ncbi:hypothetical protein UPYG_G00003290 [Umbra pygmaea]|uniref:Sushi domain-containing protein n=1 Tax=Umbra pygmaea TaxID=75934 RepID=A0ABD0XK82_UMBPY
MKPLTVCSCMFTVWIIQQALAVVTIQAQTCTKPTGGSNMVLSDAYIGQDTFPDGQQVSFKCSVGYTRARGSTRITCNAGRWSQLNMKCQPKICGFPGEIENGQFDISEGISFGATVTAICNTGYFLVGNQRRMCLDSGWSYRVPVCEVVKCGPPPPIINGGPESPPEEEYKYGDVVLYHCFKDFTMIGPKSISCSESGKFEPSPPQCIKVLCETPSVENGYRSGGGPPPYKYRSYVTFGCNPGYQLEGEASLTCGIDSTWSPTEPTCEVVKCGSPPKITDGEPESPTKNYKYGDVVVYHCFKDFTMIGPISISCSESGKFEPSPPQCLKVCPIPSVTNGYIRWGSSPPYKYRSSITLQCEPQYHLKGAATLTCGKYGTWSADYPTCEAPGCTKPTGESNMVLSDDYIDRDTFSHGVNVFFKCSIGYTSAGGSSIITCNFGRWSELFLKCEPKSCGPPGGIVNGQFDLSEGISFGATVTAICNTGYVLVGSGERTCFDSGWSGRVPVCEVVKCGPPPPITNGGPESPPEEEYKYGDVVLYHCSENFTMIGSQSIKCSASGFFEPSPPQCIKVCAKPSVKNGHRSGGDPAPYKYRSNVSLACNTGYQLKGAPRLTCGIDRTWSADYPTCEVVKCGPPPPITNGGPESPPEEEYKYGDVVLYHCSENFTVNGTQSIKCSESGKFEPSPPQCIKVLCKTPSVENGYRSGGGPPPYKYRSYVTFGCNPGYQLEGEASLTCGIDSTWSPTEPSCEVVKCGPPPPITNGGPETPLAEEYTYGDVVVYHCSENFTVNGSQSIKCSESGKFEPSPPQCLKVLCKTPSVKNGFISGGDPPPYKYRSNISLACDTGYQLKGEANLTCGIDSTWSPTEPSCEAKSCGPPGEIVNGQFDLSEGISFGATVTAICNPGYILVGTSERNCLDSGWSDRVPVCEAKSCGPPGEIVNGQFDLSEGISFGATVTAICNPGYILVGTSERNCLDSGWSDRVPVCEAKSCGNPGEIVNGQLDLSEGISFGATVTAICNPGYILVGSAERNCLDSGWSGRVPVCVGK